MTFRLEINLFGLPPTTNGSHGHWSTHAKIRRVWREKAFRAARLQRRPPAPLEKVRLTCKRFSSSEPDYDNLSISFKSVIDGLKDADVIKDDKSSVVVERKYLWERACRTQGRIQVIVEEVQCSTK